MKTATKAAIGMHQITTNGQMKARYPIATFNCNVTKQAMKSFKYVKNPDTSPMTMPAIATVIRT